MSDTLAPKKIADSSVRLSQLMLPSHTNPYGTAHGGEILKMMDNAAGACAMKHSRSVSVTAAIDDITFHEPVHMGNLVTCSAYLSYVSRRAMEVAVAVYAEDLMTGTERCCVTAYFAFVALNDKLQPVEVPPLELVNELEREEFEAGRLRMQRRKESPKVCWLPLY